MLDEGRTVGGMAALRVLAGTIEISAAILMLRYGRVSTALRINAVLGLIGPTILLVVSTLGLMGLVGRVSLERLAAVAVAVALIFTATR